MENYNFEPESDVKDVVTPSSNTHKTAGAIVGVMVVSLLPLIGFYFGMQYGVQTQKQADADDSYIEPVVDEVSVDEELPNEEEIASETNDVQPRRLNILKNLTAPDLDDGVINNEEFEFSWIVTDDVLTSFPAEYTFVVFSLYDTEGNRLAAVGDGFLLTGRTAYKDNVARFIRDGLVDVNDSYTLKATLAVQPIEFECDPLVKGECSPVYNEEDNRLRELSVNYSNESVPFIFDSSLWENINEEASVSIEGPTEVVVGEENVWTATVQNDGDDLVDVDCSVSLRQMGMNDVQVGPDDEPTPYVYSSWSEDVYSSSLRVGDVANIAWTATETTEGDAYYVIGCTPWEENGSLSGDSASIEIEAIE